MAQEYGIYRCEHCGNFVQVIKAGGGTLQCCGQAMELLAENSTDAATEKHVPQVAVGADGVTVTVGSVNHPMADDHYIEWIELVVDGRRYLQKLAAGQEPQAFFAGATGTAISARAYCNLHGLWKS